MGDSPMVPERRRSQNADLGHSGAGLAGLPHSTDDGIPEVFGLWWQPSRTQDRSPLYPVLSGAFGRVFGGRASKELLIIGLNWLLGHINDRMGREQPTMTLS